MNDGLAFEILECDIGRVGQPVPVIAQHDAMADLLKDSLFQAVAQSAYARPFLLHAGERELGRFSEPDDGRRILGAAAPPALLGSASNERLEFGALADIE